MWALFSFFAVDLCWTVNQRIEIKNLTFSIILYLSISSPRAVFWFVLQVVLKRYCPWKIAFFLDKYKWSGAKAIWSWSEIDRMENFALGQQISNGLVRNWKYLESYDFPFKNLNIFIASNTNPRSRTEWIYLHMNNLDFTMINFWLLPSFAWLRLFLLSILHVPISIFATKDFGLERCRYLWTAS